MTPRTSHTATLLLNGKVLITGGWDAHSPHSLASAELYDPVAGTFTATGDMTAGRSQHTAALLPDGRVLIVGSGSADVYDPSTGTFTAITPQHCWHGGATVLNDGKVLIAGGGTGCSNGRDGCGIVDRPELYDPVTGTFTVTGDYADKTGDPWFETAGLVGAPATLLPDGKVLIAAEPTAELYNPATGTFGLTGQMTRAAYGQEVPGGISGVQRLCSPTERCCFLEASTSSWVT
jgi:Kelch motif